MQAFIRSAYAVGLIRFYWVVRVAFIDFGVLNIQSSGNVVCCKEDNWIPSLMPETQRCWLKLVLISLKMESQAT